MKRQISGILFISICLLLIIGYIFIYKYKSEHPKAEWDTSPDNVVISYDMFGEIDYGYIPSFRVWGDGYIVWVKHDQNFTRKVYEGYLSQNQLKEIIEQFIDAGFYKWFGNKNSSSINISIDLLTGYKQNSFDANGKLSQLVEYLESGAGVDAKEFFPTVGYLYVFPIEKTEYFNRKVNPYPWPQEKFDTDFEGFEIFFPNGQEITGDELDFVWQLVNDSPFIKSNDKIYWIALGIPKITD
jgi:hypothetical protein